MTPRARRALILAARRHTLPVVESLFLSPEDEQTYAAAQPERDVPEFQRAGGDATCALCGFSFFDHPRHNPHIYVRVLCDGRVVKL